MRLRWSVGAAVLAVPLMAACALKTDCTNTGVYGVVVAVEDSTTLEPIADSTLATVAAAGGYVDTMSIIEFNIDGKPWRLGGAVDRPGTYDVFLSRIGYYDWEAHEVGVASGSCGVQPIFLRARMCRIGVPLCDAAFGP